jgi:putative nucleotidyltransferase with HDIG domain
MAVAARPWAFKTLQPLPPIAARLMQIVSSEEASFQRLSTLVRTDSAFSAEVLRVANSSLLGCRNRIDSIQHALTMLGLEKLKSLVRAVALRGFLSSALRIPALGRCWRHSLACACICEELAGAVGLNTDTAYSVGLLHDVGRLALLASYPAEYARMLDVSGEHGRDLLGCEQDLFNIDHCQAGEWLVKEWHFPEEFAAIARRHHQAWDGGAVDLLGVVQFACRMADATGFPVITSSTEDLKPVIDALPPQLAAKLGSGEDLTRTIADKVKALESTL